MKKLLFLLLLPLSCFAQYQPMGNALQRQITGSDTVFRFNLGSPGFFYTPTTYWVQHNFAPIGSGVTSVTNSDGSITFSPTTGNVIGSFNLNHTNSWVAQQNFGPVLIQGNGNGIDFFTNTGSLYFTYGSGGVKYQNASGSFDSQLIMSPSSSGSTHNIVYMPLNKGGTLAVTTDTGTFVPLTRQIVINGVSHNLSANVSYTVTATASSALTFGNGLLGGSYNGSTPITTSLDTSVAVTKTFAARYPLKSTTIATFDLRSNITFPNLTPNYGLIGTAYNSSTAQGWRLDTATLSGKYEILAHKTTTASTSITTYPNWLGVESYVGTSSLSQNNFQNYNGIVGIGDSNLAGVVSGTPGVGSGNWLNILQSSVQKPTAQNDSIGIYDFSSLNLYGITTTGSVSGGAGGIVLASGATLSFTMPSNDVEFWYIANTAGGNISISYNGTPYRTVTCNNINSTEQSSFNGTFGTPSSASGTYTLTAIGGAVTITALFQSLSNTNGKNANYFLRDAVSGYTFQSFNPTTLSLMTGLLQNTHALFLVALGTNSIYNSGVATSSTQFGIDLLSYWTALKANGNKMVYLIPPQPPGVSTILEPYSNYHTVAIAVCQANNIPYLDLNAIGLLSTDYVTNTVHYNASGHAKIATALISFFNTIDVSHQDIKLLGSKYLDQTGTKISATTTGTNTYVATILPYFSAYTIGQVFNIQFANANTGASTLNINGIGAISLIKQGRGNLASGDIVAQEALSVYYDGTEFQITTPPTPSYIWNNPGGAQTGFLNITGSGGFGTSLTVGTSANIGTLMLANSIQSTTTGAIGTSLTVGTNITQGNTTGQKIFSINGGNSSTSDGTAIDFLNGGTNTGYIGNYSAIFGGTYDSRFIIQSGGTSALFLNPGGNAINLTSPTASAGGYELLTRNTSTGNVEKVASSTFQPTITFGTGVQTALGVNIGSAGAPLLFNGAGGTPSSMTGTNITGLPWSGITSTPTTIAGYGITDVYTNVTATSPIFWNSSTKVISSQAASATVNGYLTTGSQTIAGGKTLSGSLTVTGQATFNGGTVVNGLNGGLLTFQTNTAVNTYQGSTDAIFGSGATTDWNVYTSGNNSQGFYTNSTKRMSIDGSGNVNVSGLTASSLVFTDGSKNLTSTGASGTFTNGSNTLGLAWNGSNWYFQASSNAVLFDQIAVNQQMQFGPTGNLLYFSTGYTNNTTVGVINPTVNRTINWPDASGTAVVGTFSSIASGDVVSWNGSGWINKTIGATGPLSWNATTSTVSVIGNNSRVTAQTAANSSVTTFTVGASDKSFLVSANILVTASTLHNFSVTCTYTDEGGTSRVLTLNLSQLTGAFITAITNGTGASAYEGVPVQIRAKAATTITIGTTGTFTSVTYNAEGNIQAIN